MIQKHRSSSISSRNSNTSLSDSAYGSSTEADRYLRSLLAYNIQIHLYKLLKSFEAIECLSLSSICEHSHDSMETSAKILSFTSA